MNPFLRNAERGLIRLLDWSAFQSAWIFYQQGKQARAWSADKLIVWIVSLRIRNLDVGDCKFHRNELKVNFWDDGRARANKKMFLTSTAIIFVKILILSIDDRFVNYIAINESHLSWRWSSQIPNAYLWTFVSIKRNENKNRGQLSNFLSLLSLYQATYN